MSAQPSIARPSETPTLAPQAFVDSDRRCRHCSKYMVWETHYDHEGLPFAVEECLSCSPSSTGEADYLAEYGLTYTDEDERVIAMGRALRQGAA